MCQKSSKTMGAQELGPVTIIPDDVSGRRERPIRPQTSSTFQQGERERLSGATRQSSTPPEPCPSCCSSHFTGLRPGPHSGQLPEERVGLLGPSSSCLARKHHESGPSVFTRQFALWCDGLGSKRLHPVLHIASWELRLLERDHRGVHGQLCRRERGADHQRPLPDDGCLLLLPCRSVPHNSPTDTLGDPKPPRWRKLPGGGHENLVAGHTGKLRNSRGAGTKSDAEEAP